MPATLSNSGCGLGYLLVFLVFVSLLLEFAGPGLPGCGICLPAGAWRLEAEGGGPNGTATTVTPGDTGVAIKS